MVCWSDDPPEGFLTKEGIRQIKAGLAARIFKDDLLHVYERQTEHRAELGEQSRRRMAELIAAMQNGELQSGEIERLIVKLSERLRKLKGKKQYGYLPANDKAIVDAITDELCKDERVAECYKLWCEARADVLRTYQKDPPHPGALSRQPELKRIRNIVIEEAGKLGGIESIGGGAELDVTENDAPDVETTGGGDEEQQGPTPTAETREPSPAVDKDRRSAFSARAASAATRLLHHLGKIFADNPPIPKQGARTERKLLRKLRQKKIAQGHAADDREHQQYL
jgi:hypothetical protein